MPSIGPRSRLSSTEVVQDFQPHSLYKISFSLEYSYFLSISCESANVIKPKIIRSGFIWIEEKGKNGVTEFSYKK
jgi:hypothetical protein